MEVMEVVTGIISFFNSVAHFFKIGMSLFEVIYWVGEKESFLSN